MEVTKHEFTDGDCLWQDSQGTCFLEAYNRPDTNEAGLIVWVRLPHCTQDTFSHPECVSERPCRFGTLLPLAEASGLAVALVEVLEALRNASEG